MSFPAFQGSGTAPWGKGSASRDVLCVPSGTARMEHSRSRWRERTFQNLNRARTVFEFFAVLYAREPQRQVRVSVRTVPAASLSDGALVEASKHVQLCSHSIYCYRLPPRMSLRSDERHVSSKCEQLPF